MFIDHNLRDIKDFIKTLEKRPLTVLVSINTLFNLLLKSPRFFRSDLT